MTNEELEILVKKISINFFGREFKHQAVFNSRLRTTGGRYHLKTHHLDFNPKIVEHFSMEIFEGIIKHELCHYHLHLKNKGYSHGDSDFKRLLKEVEGLRYTPSFEEKKGEIMRWSYQCNDCGIKIYRKRRFNLMRYRCGQCYGTFFLEGKEKVKNQLKVMIKDV